MPLAALAWKRLPDQTVSPQTIVGALDAIYAAGTSATYYDGSARTQGVGSAHTVSRYQNAGTTEAVYGTPPGTTLGVKWIMAGQATATKTPTMLSPDTFAAGKIVGSEVKNAGAFNAWDNAAPFTSGDEPGYSYLLDAVGTGSRIPSKVYCFESPESWIVLLETTTGALMACELPWTLDPYSTNALAQETDGRRYGLRCSGTTAIGIAFNSDGDGTDGFLNHATGNGQNHAWIRDIGLATSISVYRQFRANLSTTSSMLNAAGEFVRFRVPYRRNAAAPNDRFVGQDRTFAVFRDGKALQNHSNSGGTLLGWLIAGSLTVDQDAVLLTVS